MRTEPALGPAPDPTSVTPPGRAGRRLPTGVMIVVYLAALGTFIPSSPCAAARPWATPTA